MAWDPSKTNINVTLSSGNRVALSTVSSTDLTVISNWSKSAGKWYWEIPINNLTTAFQSAGICDQSNYPTSFDEDDRSGWNESWAYMTHTSTDRVYHDGSYTSGGNNDWSDNDILGFAVDIPNGKWWLSLNGTWINSGDPANGTNPLHTDASINTTISACQTSWASGDEFKISDEEDQWTYSAPTGFDAPVEGSELTDGIGLADAVVVSPEYYPIVPDDIGLTDEVSATGGTTYATLPDAIGINDSILANVEQEMAPIAEGFGISDLIDAWIFPGRITDGLGLDESIQAAFEYPVITTDGIGFADVVDGLNWTQWIRENGDLAIKRYLFTLTGSPDNTTDVEIPINAFQARKRTGYDTYLSVNIPGFTYATQISNRVNGEMVLELGYEINGIVEIREEFLRVDFTKINEHEGSRNRSYQLIGYKTHNFANQTIEIANANYRTTDDGRILYRFPHVDPWINPGDTCRVRNDEFTVDYISYTISERNSVMEIREI